MSRHADSKGFTRNLERARELSRRMQRGEQIDMQFTTAPPPERARTAAKRRRKMHIPELEEDSREMDLS